VRSEAATIVFTIEDNGAGISDDDLARVGEPYFQAGASYDRRHGGTGLGLFIVKGLVRLHGGDLSIWSRIGEGTRVTVRLPIDCERSRPSKKAASQRSGVSYFASAVAAHSTPSVSRGSGLPHSDNQVKKRA